MNLNPIKQNMNEVTIGNKTVLFSYKTPVAYYDDKECEYFVTEKKWSKTTSRHINQWLSQWNQTQQTAATVSQETLDNLLNEVK